MIRGGLISMLYSKATEVPLVHVDAASSITLMSADVERIVTGMETAHEVRGSIRHAMSSYSYLGGFGVSMQKDLRKLLLILHYRSGQI